MTISDADSQSRLVFTLADGGALQDNTERAKQDELTSGEFRRPDLLRLPNAICNALRTQDRLGAVEAPREGRILYVLGSASGASFVEKMQQEWTVEVHALGVCRYERAPEERTARAPFKVRFHAAIAYQIGCLATRARDLGRPVTVCVVSDDAHLIPPMALARANHGLDVRLVWFSAALPSETAYFAARNGVPTVLIGAETSTTHRPKPTLDAMVNALLSSSPRDPER